MFNIQFFIILRNVCQTCHRFEVPTSCFDALQRQRHRSEHRPNWPRLASQFFRKIFHVTSPLRHYVTCICWIWWVVGMTQADSRENGENGLGLESLNFWKPSSLWSSKMFQGRMSNIPWPRAPNTRGLGSAEISMFAHWKVLSGHTWTYMFVSPGSRPKCHRNPT